jgi:hypothetical protein
MNSFIACDWSMPRAFCNAGHCSVQSSLSVRSPTPAAFATIRISHEDSAIGSVTCRAPIRREMVTLATERGVPVLMEVCHGFTKSNLEQILSARKIVVYEHRQAA